MAGTCNTHGNDANAYGNSNLENFWIRFCLKGPRCIEGRIIKVHLVPKHDVRVRNGISGFGERRGEAVVNTVMNFLVPQSAGHILTV